MFGKLMRKLAEMSKPPEIDPARFDDPLAAQIEWTAVKRGGTNFRTHRLVRHPHRPERIEFKATVGLKLFCLVFVVIGIAAGTIAPAVMAGRGDVPPIALLIPIGVSLVFIVVATVIYRLAARPRVFDKSVKYFWLGRKTPEVVFAAETSDKWVLLDDIHAVQIVREFCRSDKSSYTSYELNLVLHDGRRMNVVDHGNQAALQADAREVAAFLGVPVWDGSG